jgi:nesprin-1
MIASIQELCVIVANILSLGKIFTVFLDAVEYKLEAALKQWLDFEDQLDKHTKWFRGTETTFRDQQLQATLAKKEAQLEIFKGKRDLIMAKEKEVDDFVDCSHSLLNYSGADRIKPLISQISNRCGNSVKLEYF